VVIRSGLYDRAGGHRDARQTGSAACVYRRCHRHGAVINDHQRLAPGPSIAEAGTDDNEWGQIMTGQIQDRNSQMVDNLRADLQPRYEPNFAWKGITGLYQALPALRGFWPMSAQINATQAAYVTDVANNFHLANPAAAQHGYDDLIPYVDFNGTTQYLFYVDNAQFDILGTETTVVAAQRGLTLGLWVKDLSAAAPDSGGLIAKSLAAGNQRSYDLMYNPANTIEFFISPDGTGTGLNGVRHTTTLTVDPTVWSFLVGRFDPTGEMAVFIDGQTDALAVGIPATIFNSTANLEIGTREATYFTGGKFSMAFICASALSDSIITAIWQQTRAMFRR